MAQSWIQPQQNSLIDAFQQAEQIKAYRAKNALAEAQVAELPYERERLQALNTANVGKAEALTEKAQAETGRIDQDAAQRDLEFVARFPGDRQAVLGALAKWVPKMPQLAPIAERLSQIQDPDQFAGEVTSFAVSSLDRMKEARAREEHADLEAHRGQQLDISRGQLGVSQANAAESRRFHDASLAQSRDLAVAKIQQPTPKIAAQNRDKLQTIAVLEQQLARVQAAASAIQNSLSSGPGGGYLPTEAGRSFDAAVDGLRPFLRQISRTPGEGAMSDYETKQAEALLPSRSEYENVTAQKIQQIMDVVAQLKSGYAGDGQTAPTGGPPRVVIPYGSAPSPNLGNIPAGTTGAPPQRATNPKTGEVLELQGGQWRPVK